MGGCWALVNSRFSLGCMSHFLLHEEEKEFQMPISRYVRPRPIKENTHFLLSCISKTSIAIRLVLLIESTVLPLLLLLTFCLEGSRGVVNVVEGLRMLSIGLEDHLTSFFRRD